MTDFASTSGPQFETIAQLFSQFLWLQSMWDGFVIPQITSYWGSYFNGVLTSSIGRVACLRFGAGLLVPLQGAAARRCCQSAVCALELGCCRVLLQGAAVRALVLLLVQLVQLVLLVLVLCCFCCSCCFCCFCCCFCCCWLRPAPRRNAKAKVYYDCVRAMFC